MRIVHKHCCLNNSIFIHELPLFMHKISLLFLQDSQKMRNIIKSIVIQQIFKYHHRFFAYFRVQYIGFYLFLTRKELLPCVFCSIASNSLTCLQHFLFASQAPCNSGVSLETPTSQEQELAALVNQSGPKPADNRCAWMLPFLLGPSICARHGRTKFFRIMTRRKFSF